MWNAVSQREEPALMLSKGRVEAVAFSPDGRLLASTGTTAKIWDFETRSVMAELDQGPRAYSICVAFPPSSRVLATGGGFQSSPGSPFEDCGIKLWDAKTGHLITFLPHERPVHSLCFLPGGERIVAGGESGELRMWDIPAGALTKAT